MERQNDDDRAIYVIIWARRCHEWDFSGGWTQSSAIVYAYLPSRLWRPLSTVQCDGSVPREQKKINGGLSSALAMVEWQIYFLHSFYLSRTYIACNNVPFSFHSHKCWIAKRNWHRICKWLAPHNMDYVPNCTTVRCTSVYKTITGNTSICLDSIEPKTASWVNELKHCDSLQLSTHTHNVNLCTQQIPPSQRQQIALNVIE